MTDLERFNQYVNTHKSPYIIGVVARKINVTYGAAAVFLAEFRIVTGKKLVWDKNYMQLMEAVGSGSE